MQIKKPTEGEELVMKAVWYCRKEPVLSEVLERVNGVYGKDWRPGGIIKKYFKPEDKAKDIETIIDKALELYFNQK